jgi:hypothetical protein
VYVIVGDSGAELACAELVGCLQLLQWEQPLGSDQVADASKAAKASLTKQTLLRRRSGAAARAAMWHPPHPTKCRLCAYGYRPDDSVTDDEEQEAF